MHTRELHKRKDTSSENVTVIAIHFKDCIGLYYYLKEKVDIPDFNAYQTNSLNNMMLSNVVDFFIKNVNGRKPLRPNFKEVIEYLSDILLGFDKNFEDINGLDFWLHQYHDIIFNFLMKKYRSLLGNTIFLGYWEEGNSNSLINNPKAILHCSYIYKPTETFQVHNPWNENYLLFIKRIKEI